MSDKKTASVDMTVCKGHGRCYMTAPGIFDCDDEGYPIIVGVAETPEQISELERALNNCPEQAITLISA